MKCFSLENANGQILMFLHVKVPSCLICLKIIAPSFLGKHPEGRKTHTL